MLVLTPRVGDEVRCERTASAQGSWSRYAGRVGAVVSVNRQRFDNGAPDYIEIGVSFGSTANVSAWFRPDELVAVDSALIQRRERRLTAATVEVAL